MAPWLRGNVLALGLTSLLNDASSEMIAPFLPMFVATTLGGGATALGAIEGLGEAVSNLLKLWSGRRSDRTRRVPWLFAGYGLSVLTKPLVALAGAPWHVAAIRIVDRTGKGLRTSPRDALIAASVAPEHRAAAFGFHRAMDHAGAVLGPLAALGLYVATGDLRTVFAAAAIPGLLVLGSIGAGVREAAIADRGASAPPAPAPWRLLVPIALFTVARAPDGFVLLSAVPSGDPVEAALAWAALHAVKAALSTPLSSLADRLGRRWALAASWAWAAAIYVALAGTLDGHVRLGLFLAWGVHAAFGEGSEKALIAEYAGRGREGAAFGAYHLVVGLVAIPGALALGALWDAFGPEVAYLWCAGVAGLALAALAAGGRGGR